MSLEDLSGILPLLLIVLVFWFLVIRPSRKRQQETSRVQSTVAVGAEIMLGSGIYGTVLAAGDDTIQMEVSPGTSIKVARQAVVRVVEPVVHAQGDDGAPHVGGES
ncbi:MAG TPA: preprotein translocase subunit YajC [Nocardioidaceae bacterium]|nr:preprotein translocase subunit YajC [Nocardioidaceae bacterium]